MAILIKNSIIETNGKFMAGIPADELFVFVPDVGAIAINQLKLGGDRKDVNTASDYLRCIADKDFPIFYETKLGETKIINPESKIYKSQIVLPKYILTKEYGREGKPTLTPKLNRVFNLEKEESYVGDFLFVRLKGEGNYQLINKEHIGYYKAEKFVSLRRLQATRAIRSFADLENKPEVLQNLCLDINYANKKVERVFIDATFNILDECENCADKIDLDNEEMIKFSLNFESTAILKTKVQNIMADYVEQRLVKKDNQNYIETKIYTCKKDGKYILVQFADDDIETLVPLKDIESIWEDGVFKPCTSRLKDIIGKVVKVKGYASATYPISYENFLMRYNLTSGLQATCDGIDVLKKGTYLMLDDGRFVEERFAVLPKCYEYCGVREATAYLVRGNNQYFVVDKDKFNKKVVLTNGVWVDWSKRFAFPIKLSTKPLMECDVIQTSNNVVENSGLSYHVQDACAINYYLNDELMKPKTEDKEKLVLASYTTFIERYRQGKYPIDSVIVDGKFIATDERNIRYKNADATYSMDENNACLTKGAFRVKDENSGPKYNYKEAVKNSILNLTKEFKQMILFMLELPGWLTMLLIAPSVVLGLIVLMFGVAIVPLVEVFNKAKQNSVGFTAVKKYKAKRSADLKVLDEELDELLERLFADPEFSNQDFTLPKAYKLTKAELINAFNKLENLALQNMGGKYISKFTSKTPIMVGEHNAEQYERFIKTRKQLKDGIVELEKDGEENNEIVNILTEKLDDLEHNFFSSGVKIKTCKTLEEKLEKIRELKAFVLVKKFPNDFSFRLTKEEEIIFEDLTLNDVCVGLNDLQTKARLAYIISEISEVGFYDCLQSLINKLHNFSCENFVLAEANNVPANANLEELVDAVVVGETLKYTAVEDFEEEIVEEEVVEEKPAVKEKSSNQMKAIVELIDAKMQVVAEQLNSNNSASKKDLKDALNYYANNIAIVQQIKSNEEYADLYLEYNLKFKAWEELYEQGNYAVGAKVVEKVEEEKPNEDYLKYQSLAEQIAVCKVEIEVVELEIKSLVATKEEIASLEKKALEIKNKIDDMQKESVDYVEKIKEAYKTLDSLHRTMGLMPDNMGVASQLYLNHKAYYEQLKKKYSEFNYSITATKQELDAVEFEKNSKFPEGCKAIWDINDLISDLEIKNKKLTTELQELEEQKKRYASSM